MIRSVFYLFIFLIVFLQCNSGRSAEELYDTIATQEIASFIQLGLFDGSVTKYTVLTTIIKSDKRTDIEGISDWAGFNMDPTKVAMQTIRIPLVQFESQGLSLSSIQKVEFKFPSNWGDNESIRKVTIDNVMFTV